MTDVTITMMQHQTRGPDKGTDGVTVKFSYNDKVIDLKIPLSIPIMRPRDEVEREVEIKLREIGLLLTKAKVKPQRRDR